MKIFISRHGQTDMNLKRRVCGIEDFPLNDTGIKQAQQLAQNCVGKGIDKIICSPLTRARVTAETVGKALGIKVVTDGRLLEQDYGKKEGCSWDDEEYQILKKNFAKPFPDGESMLQVAHRAYDFLDELIEKYNDKTVLIVCHGSISRIMNTYFTGMTNDEFWGYLLDNCELKEYNV